MADFKAAKVVSALPTPLEADTVYFIRSGAGFDLKVTNGVGEVVALPLNPSPVPASPWVAVPLEATVEIPVDYNFMYRTFADMVQIAGTFKTVSALSEGSLIGNMPAGLFPAEGLVVTGKGYYLGEDGQIKSSAAIGEGEIVHTGVVSYPLVMPEPERLQGNMLTVGELFDGPNNEYHGYMSNYYEEDDKVGDLSDSNFEAIPYPVVAITVSRWYGGTPARNHYEAAVRVAEAEYLEEGLYRLTVGDWSRLLVGSWMGLLWNDSGFIHELPLMTKADFDAFPRTGTHPVTIEYLGV